MSKVWVLLAYCIDCGDIAPKWCCYIHEFTYDMRHATRFLCHYECEMKSVLFIAIVLISDFSSGIIFKVVNFVTTESFLDSVIELENKVLFESGEKDSPEFSVEYNFYRGW